MIFKIKVVLLIDKNLGGVKMKRFVLFLLFSAVIYSQTTLSPGDLLITAINGDNDPPNYGRGFSVVNFVYLQPGTEIYFTDYGWSDLTNHFITNTGIADVFVKYTVPAGGHMPGTIIRCDQYHTTNITYVSSYSGSGNNYLNVGGLSQGDEVLVFQGTIDAPTFICAASIVSTTIVPNSWATGVTANGTDGAGSGSALPPGLTDDVNAFSLNRAAAANDNCAYTGLTTAATTAEWKTRIINFGNWTFNDAIPIPTPLAGPITITDAFPVELTSFSLTAINSNINLTWSTKTEVNNYGFDVEKSVSGGNWEKIGFVTGSGNSNSPKNYSYTDNSGIYSCEYRLKQIDIDGRFEYSKIISTSESVPTSFNVEQNYPNPFNPSTRISFAIPKNSYVEVKLYNTLGSEVANLFSGEKTAGSHFIDVDAKGLTSGVYFYKVTAAGNSITKKMILAK